MGKPRSELLSGLGTAFEVLKRIVDAVRAQGGTDEDVRAILNSKTLAQEVAKVIIAARPGAQSKPAIVLPTEVRALIPDWLKPDPVEHVPATDFFFEKMKFVSFLNAGESSVDSKTMRSRAVTLQGNLGVADAPRILVYLNKVKPKELQGCYIVLPGTVLSGSDGDLYVPYLYWDGGQWVLDFRWLGGSWHDGDRIACCK